METTFYTKAQHELPFYSLLVGIARNYVGDDAEDMVQETYTKTLEYTDGQVGLGYLIAVLRNLLFTAHAQQEQSESFILDPNLVEHILPASSDIETSVLIHEAFSSLSYEDQSLVFQIFMRGEKQEDVAESLHIQQPAISKRLSRIRATLREKMT